MWFALYQLLLLVAYPLVRVRILWRARREPEYGQRVGERFGKVPAGIPVGAVWFHTVSAGETIAAAPLISTLVARYPDAPFLVTTMTPTGSQQVRERLQVASERPVAHCYAPYDFPWAVERFFNRVQPRLLVLMETELWPNLIARATRLGVPVLLVNARLSERSAAGYRRLGGLVRTMLARLTLLACQYPDHAERFRALGAPPERIRILGSVKFDVALPDDADVRVAALRARWDLGDAPVWIAGSTHPGEEAAVLAAHAELRNRVPGARLILVPRHPSRCGEVAALCRERGFRVARQSEPEPGDPRADVILGDVMGQLLYLYGLSQAAFLGGSLVPVGGHNPIEPALWGQPLLMGPETFNFPDVVARFVEAGCLVTVQDAGGLAASLAALLSDPEARASAATAARQVVMANRGAGERLLTLLAAQIDAAVAQ